MSIHDGHRKRLKERFRKEGLENFDDLYILELLLYYCIPRKDTNIISHRLLERFGSLRGVLDANQNELEKIEDIGPNCTSFFALLKAVWRKYEEQRAQNNIYLNTIDACGEYLRPKFLNRDVETIYLLCLDAKCKLITCQIVGEGSVNSASISIRKIAELAINSNATSVVLAHNHPGGLAVPSPEDIQTTQRVYSALAAVEIVLADHLVFADGEYISLLQSGRLPIKQGFGSCT